MDRPAPSLLKPALIGGVAAGVASSVPGLQYVNCACCALVIGGGFLAAFLFSKDAAAAGVSFTAGRGAAVGVVAGLFYALTSGVVSALIVAVFGNPMAQSIAQMEEMGTEIPPEAAQFVESLAEAGPLLVGTFSAGVGLLIGCLFCTIGGVIGGAAFKFEPPPPASPMQGAVPPPPAVE